MRRAHLPRLRCRDELRIRRRPPRRATWNTVALVALLALATGAVVADPCPDSDLDGYADCTIPGCDSSGLECGDCIDSLADTYPEAPQLCDGWNNDCNDPEWPNIPSDEIDMDGDSLSECQGGRSAMPADAHSREGEGEGAPKL